VNYIGPMHVSFQGVKVAEIPCTNVVPPEGWFATTNYTGPLTHSYGAGAGPLHPISSNNFWMEDNAGRDHPYENWSWGRLTWKIPIGWKRILYEGETFTYAGISDFEEMGNSSSRPLLVGGCDSAYLQIFTIDANGTSSVEKFGHKLQRSRWVPAGAVSVIQEVCGDE